MYTNGNSDVSERSLRPHRFAEGGVHVGVQGGVQGECRVGAAEVVASRGVLAAAESDEHRQRLRVWDLARPGPKGPAN